MVEILNQKYKYDQVVYELSILNKCYITNYPNLDRKIYSLRKFKYRVSDKAYEPCDCQLGVACDGKSPIQKNSFNQIHSRLFKILDGCQNNFLAFIFLFYT